MGGGPAKIRGKLEYRVYETLKISAKAKENPLKKRKFNPGVRKIRRFWSFLVVAGGVFITNSAPHRYLGSKN